MDDYYTLYWFVNYSIIIQINNNYYW